MLAVEQIENFRRDGQLTVPDLFNVEQIDGALADLAEWDAEFRATLTDEQREWYLEDPADPASPFRKLDNPVFHRAAFRELATAPALVEAVEQLIGKGVTLFFSQVFCKPPEVGGPKPVHQDNFYFAPSDTGALLTTWIALDAATEENGCLYYGHGSHREQVLEHTAPEAEPFNLQVPAAIAAKYPMTPAPVPRGGVSIHHGNTLHQSSANRSNHPRRAVTFHFLQNDAQLVNPALDYEPSNVVKIS
jgi:ectoine hydroxylase-related dioxygenase (phytanoyl-CoA dioxygenase family)